MNYGTHSPMGINSKIGRKELPIPINPVVYSTLRALYSGGTSNHWTIDIYGRPHYTYKARDGEISIFYELSPESYLPFCETVKDAGHLSYFRQYGYPPCNAVLHDSPIFQRHFLASRWGFIYAGRLREAIRNLSAETADVFLILMVRIASLDDPRRDIASIRLEEIAEYRGVRVRHGSSQRLYDDFKQEILRLADLRLTMIWRDYKSGHNMVFGKERGDRLLDIVDMEYKRDGKTLTTFRFRCGQALVQFLNQAGLRWIGYYSKALLQLNPYHDAFTKKLGTYWIMLGIIAGKKGMYPKASPRIILDFCGEEIKWRNPGQTVDAFIEAHHRLQEIGVLDLPPILEPANRRRGYFLQWLDTPLIVRLSKNIWHVEPNAKKDSKSLNNRNNNAKAICRKKELFDIPKTPQELQNDARLIKRFRGKYGIDQLELAKAMGITRQTLSKYERGINPLPEQKAKQIIGIWLSKEKSLY